MKIHIWVKNSRIRKPFWAIALHSISSYYSCFNYCLVLLCSEAVAVHHSDLTALRRKYMCLWLVHFYKEISFWVAWHVLHSNRVPHLAMQNLWRSTKAQRQWCGVTMCTSRWLNMCANSWNKWQRINHGVDDDDDDDDGDAYSGVASIHIRLQTFQHIS